MLKATDHLVKHPNPLVRYPSLTGAFLGVIVGAPVALVALPITYPLGKQMENNTGKPGTATNTMYSPMTATGEGGTLALGGPFWLLFGWWKPVLSSSSPAASSPIKPAPKRAAPPSTIKK